MNLQTVLVILAALSFLPSSALAWPADDGRNYIPDPADEAACNFGPPQQAGECEGDVSISNWHHVLPVDELERGAGENSTSVQENETAVQENLTSLQTSLHPCKDSADVVNAIYVYLGDADCDGYTNEEELESGCSPADNRSNPDESECTLVGPVPPEGLVEEVTHCNASGDPLNLIFVLLGDADCDGWTNEEELKGTTNPLDPDDPS